MQESAEILALKGLGWLVRNPESLGLFVRASGIEPAALRAGAGSRGTACAVLDFLLANEALLVAFCADENIAPKEIHRSRQLLDGG
jgi:hypothetical protein